MLIVMPYDHLPFVQVESVVGAAQPDRNAVQLQAVVSLLSERPEGVLCASIPPLYQSTFPREPPLKFTNPAGAAVSLQSVLSSCRDIVCVPTTRAGNLKAFHKKYAAAAVRSQYKPPVLKTRPPAAVPSLAQATGTHSSRLSKTLLTDNAAEGTQRRSSTQQCSVCMLEVCDECPPQWPSCHRLVCHGH